MLPFLVLKEKDAARLWESVPIMWGKGQGRPQDTQPSSLACPPGWASLASAELCFLSFLSLEAGEIAEQPANLQANVQGGRRRR